MREQHVCECWNAGADESWFHLYQIVQPAESTGTVEDDVTSSAVALEQFMQTATLGEYSPRLQLLLSFKAQAKVLHRLCER
jgi:hypothetical protein